MVTRRDPGPRQRFGSVAAAVAAHGPGYVVIANRTSEHRKALSDLAAADHRGTVLVEKPLFESLCELPPMPFEHLFVGYNLRFHPGLQRLRSLLSEERVLSVQVYAGQYLPDWRPGRDYRDGYSTRESEGGGVLRDLSHELDYLTWIFGGWRAVTAAGGKLSRLEMDCEDTVVALLELEACPAVALQLNYLDRAGRRTIVVNTDRQTFELDLVAGRLSRAPSADGDREAFSVDRDTTYRDQHRAVLEGRHDDLCTLEQGQDTLRLIAAIERAMATRTWVGR